jgi:hypothetical protein
MTLTGGWINFVKHIPVDACFCSGNNANRNSTALHWAATRHPLITNCGKPQQRVMSLFRNTQNAPDNLKAFHSSRCNDMPTQDEMTCQPPFLVLSVAIAKQKTTPMLIGHVLRPSINMQD